MLGGSIVIETVFALHGVGYLGWESIAKNDFPVVQAVVLVLAAIYIGLTLLIGIMTVITSGLIGITLGVLGGFLGGRVDDAVLFAITTRLSIPVVLVALAVVGLMGSGLGERSR